MFIDEQLVMISAIQHMAFCERQCALIHIEKVWAENHLTVQGEVMHEKVHKEEKEKRGDKRIVRSLRLASYQYGITGQSDVVEFHKSDQSSYSAKLPDAEGYWIPFPVEYKRGKPKKDMIDEVQLCAQAMCLEEMLFVEIKSGALFYGENKRRVEVEFTQKLRDKTISLISSIHKMVESKITPKAVLLPKCKNCSLVELCNPQITAIIKKKRYEKMLFGEEE